MNELAMAEIRLQESVGAAQTAGAGCSNQHAEGAQQDAQAFPSIEEPLAPDMAVWSDEEHYCFVVSYGKSSMEVRLPSSQTVGLLKEVLFSLSDVPEARQKILGLARGKLPDNDTALVRMVIPTSSLRDSPHPMTGEKRITIKLIGTPLAQTFVDPHPIGDTMTADNTSSGKPVVLRESSDIDYNDPTEVSLMACEPRNDPRARRKLGKAISIFSLTFPVMHEPRTGLKGGLLVLDLDYTIVDTKRLFSHASAPHEAMRPGLHEMLAAVYPYYDICVWSQTSHWWLEAKLTELGCLTHSQYRISFVLDRTPMFKVRYSPKDAVEPVSNSAATASTEKRPKCQHEVKALEVIWRRFGSTYGAHNTIHIDDLARNGAMNPKNLLKIKAYRHKASRQDEELPALRDYLLKLAHSSITDFTALGGHLLWKKCMLPSVLEEEQTGSTTASAAAAGEKPVTEGL